MFKTTVMTIRQALEWGLSQLSQSATPLVDARLLLCHVLQKTTTYLIAFDDVLLSESEASEFQQLVVKASQQTPIPYLIGHAPFYGRDFRVSPAVLIPRSETEELVVLALNWLRENNKLNVVDVGTGSGCIAVTMACEMPALNIQAVDVSAAALAVAQENAGILLPPNRTITFHHGHLLDPISQSVDLIVANLPYIGEEEWQTLSPHVRDHEPQIALTAANEGTALIDAMLSQAATKITTGGAIMLEHGWQQGQAVVALAQRYFPRANIKLKQDYAGIDRMVLIKT
jgi:release factor glutamine methyltransferase